MSQKCNCYCGLGIENQDVFFCFFTSDGWAFWVFESNKTRWFVSTISPNKKKKPQRTLKNFQSKLEQGLIPGGNEKDSACHAVFVPERTLWDDPEEEESLDDFSLTVSSFRHKMEV